MTLPLKDHDEFLTAQQKQCIDFVLEGDLEPIEAERFADFWLVREAFRTYCWKLYYDENLTLQEISDTFGGIYDRSHARKLIHREVRISRAGLLRSVDAIDALPPGYIPKHYEKPLLDYIAKMRWTNAV